MMVLITGRACTAYDLALRLMGGRLPDFAGRSGHPSIAGLPMNPGIDVMGQKQTARLARYPATGA